MHKLYINVKKNQMQVHEAIKTLYTATYKE